MCRESFSSNDDPKHPNERYKESEEILVVLSACQTRRQKYPCPFSLLFWIHLHGAEAERLVSLCVTTSLMNRDPRVPMAAIRIDGSPVVELIEMSCHFPVRQRWRLSHSSAFLHMRMVQIALSTSGWLHVKKACNI